MHFQISAATAAAILAMISETSAHAVFTSVIGNANQGIQGHGLGFDKNTPRKGTAQVPFQQDVAVLSNPIVPAVPGTPWFGKPRTYWANGCGSTIQTLNNYYSTAPQFKALYAKYTPDQRNRNFYQYPARATIDHKTMTAQMARANQLPQATAGGWLRIMVYQVNADGAGPFRCKIDSTGTATSWGPWIQPVVPNNVPGTAELFSVKADGSMQTFPLTIPIPAGQTCTGTAGYSGRNVCMMRCENYAKNGQFGGCIPFVLVNNRYNKPVVKPPPRKGYKNLGYDESPIYKKVKRDEDDDDAKVAMGDEELDEEDQDIAKKQIKNASSEKKGKLREMLKDAKDANDQKSGSD